MALLFFTPLIDYRRKNEAAVASLPSYPFYLTLVNHSFYFLFPTSYSLLDTPYLLLALLSTFVFPLSTPVFLLLSFYFLL